MEIGGSTCIPWGLGREDQSLDFPICALLAMLHSGKDRSSIVGSILCFRVKMALPSQCHVNQKGPHPPTRNHTSGVPNLEEMDAPVTSTGWDEPHHPVL